MNGNTEESNSDFQPREYQIELFEKALKQNSIIFLPTGSGKTFIATMVLKHLSKDIEKKFTEGGKRTFFLVCTVALAQQQSLQIKRQVPFNVGTYTGERGVDLWKVEKWNQELDDHEILVMTAQIFLDMLRHSYITLSQVNLLIMDECHHAVNKHAMKQIMVLFDGVQESDRPRVLGLTATLLNASARPEQISDEIHELEITLHAKICRAKDEELIKRFSTNPTEEVIYFNLHSNNEDSCSLIITKSINNLISIVTGVHIEYNDDISYASDGTQLIRDRKSVTKKMINLLKEVLDVADSIGILAASYALLARLFTVERLKLSCPDRHLYLMYSMVTTTIHKIRKILRVQMDKYSASELAYVFSTPKLKALFEKLENFGSSSTAIIFVERRITAQVLYYVFKHLSQNNDKFCNIRPDFIVGVNLNQFNNTREPELERKKNKETLKRFNNKETNVLFASDVVEEGIDIQHCNYVIKFDMPKTLCSYIQSKGRARNKDSKYIIFAPIDGKKPFRFTHDEYRKAEKNLTDELSYGKDQGRRGGTEAEAKIHVYKHEEEPFYVAGPGSAVVSLTSSISLLNRYCSMLPSDKFTVLTVTYWKHITPDLKTVVSLQLPMNSPLRDVIKGAPCANLLTAKASAALEACRRLYHLKELNDKLLPVGPEFEIDEKYVFPLWIDNDNEGCNVGKLPRPGTKKRQRIYDKKVPAWMCGCTPKPFAPTYLHVIRMTPSYDYPSSNRLKAFYNLLSSSNNFAFLSSNRWPKVCEFPMFLNVGEVKITIEENYSVKKLSAYEMKEIFDFHCLLVTEVLPMKKKFLVKDLDDGRYSYYIVPVLEKSKGFDIDWDTIRQHKNIPEPKPIPLDSRGNIVVTKDKYHCKVVIPWYRPQSLMLRYIVTNVCEDETPLSPFPSENFTSYAHYFDSRYNQKIVNVNQPLLEVRAISQKTNCLLPRGKCRLGKRKKRDEDDLEEVLVPELCLLLEFPSVYLLKATVIPSIVHRLTLLFLAEELRLKIAAEVGLGKEVLPNDFVWEPLKTDEQALCLIDEQPNQLKSTIEISNMLASEMESLNPSDCPWDKADEPCDIDRNLETVDLLSIIYYDKFAKTKLFEDPNVSLNSYPLQNSGYLNKAVECHRLPENSEIPQIKFLKSSHNSLGPQLNELIQVLISNAGNDIINYERLETLGDSFLKFMACLVLFVQFPDKDEGKLTNLKGKIVGNRNLFYCGRHIKMGPMLKINPFAVDDWDVPHYKILDVIKNLLRDLKFSPSVLFQLNLLDEERDTSILTNGTLEQLYTLLSNASEQDGISAGALHTLQQEVICDKIVADSVEALIGAYFKACGIEGSFKLCKWLQLIPSDWADIHDVLYKPAPTAHLNSTFTVDHFLIQPDQLEKNLGYKFKDRSYLLQALSHSSFSQWATDCYQRLEFLGDAILDFLITCHIYDKCGNLGPGELTDLRSALVNNVTFACLVVRYGFHKFILSKAVLLSKMIGQFAEQQERRHHRIGAEVLLMVNEDDVKVGEIIDVPKILGDIFESLAGAVYLDSGKSLETVWNVFYRLMHNEINEFSKNVPKNNIRLLYEKFPNPLPVFEAVKWDKPGYLVSVTVLHNGERKYFYGYGDNKASAKMAAAKVALRQCHSVGDS